MVQDSAQIRRRGAQDFMSYYEFACARQESVPLPAVKMNLEKGMLDFNGDRVKLTDWPPILNSVSINKHLHHIAISSTYQASLGSGDADRRFYKSTLKKKIPAIRSKDMTFKLCKALRDCMSASSNLKTLQLNGLPLRERDLIILTKGFAKSVSLENLSLANCPISDEGLEVICQSVKYSACIRTVDFTGCNLTWRGAEHMANIIKHQGMQRHGTAWAESLRYRQPQFEGMGGLRRITLNCNTLIGDRGAAALANELTEDLWVKAVDLQRCGLSSEGARRLLEALKTNSTLCVLDIRNNPLVDKVLIKTIIEKVLMNADGQSQEYCWIKPAATEPQRAARHKRRPLPASVRGKAALRIASHKVSPGGRSSGGAQPRLSSHSNYVPWRAAARAGRQRGLPPGAAVLDQSFEGAATVKVTVETDSEEEDEEGEEVVVEVEQRLSPLNVHDRITGRQFERIQMELKECRLRLAEERRARLKAETRLMEFELENARLHSTNQSLSEALASTGFTSAPAAVSVLEDEAVLESIENSFTKFHAFLDLLKDAGLGQLASMAGIDKSDFQPLGKPQLSSTIGPPMDGTTQNAKADVSVMVSSTPPAHPSGHFEIFTPTSLPAIREPLHRPSKLDVTFTQVAGSAVVPGVHGEGDPDQYSKPVTHESGSERSFGGQKSFEGLPFGKTFETQPRHTKSNSNSQRSNSLQSNGSHRYSFNNSYTNSDASNSKGSHGGLSVRSSVSEVLSDKAESLRSTGSKRREGGRLMTEGRSGSEGSEGGIYPGMEILEQVRSLSSLGGHSDHESF
ncbi:centrosomal protein of 78 kDa [Sphaeramia orbicularis]|uniref:centrosomal protein of 78 kDa n=1 Tax=Sphaeramia orbicularis TaxID=375764 RepID=UPI00117C8104|nr:centrosomal protein of 78 kDa [Sphaeramia orbicularis]XP_030000436.1 centrosomal protein of 78 kDa [Sphaeramia orbicularis]XP_030000437.1 centrosomal protein of 78 kDa [Sphaeramia orbicularis]